MPRTKAKVSPQQGPFRRAKSAIVRLFRRDRGVLSHEQPAAPQTHSVRLQSDIPIHDLEQAYTPSQTSLKAGFRSSGADHESDQEYARGVPDDRWSDEDRMTNRSGDPRIGTHGRTYEPGEARAAQGRNEDE